MKKVMKLLAFILIAIVGLFMLGDKIEAWAFEKYGEDEVRAYMKKFEPFITLTPNEDTMAKGIEEELEVCEEA